MTIDATHLKPFDNGQFVKMGVFADGSGALSIRQS